MKRLSPNKAVVVQASDVVDMPGVFKLENDRGLLRVSFNAALLYSQGLPRAALKQIPNEHRIKVLEWIQDMEEKYRLGIRYQDSVVVPGDEPSRIKKTNARGAKQSIAHGGVVVVDFTSTWCGPCQAIKPLLEELSRNIEEGIRILMVDVDKNEAWADELGLEAVPCVVFWRDGQVVHSILGEQPYEAYERALAHATR